MNEISALRLFLRSLKMQNVKDFLVTDTFNRFLIKKGFDATWNLYFLDAQRRGPYGMTEDQKTRAILGESALSNLLTDLYNSTNNKTKALLTKPNLRKLPIYVEFKDFLFDLLTVFIHWKIDFSTFHNVFEDLALCNFPKPLLEELKEQVQLKQLIPTSTQATPPSKPTQAPQPTNKAHPKPPARPKKIVVDQAKLIELVSQHKLDEVIKTLLDLAKRSGNTTHLKTAVNLSARWRRIKEKEQRNLISTREADIEINKINEGMIDLIMGM
ncbi:MAG: hypothetical protein AAF990_27865 [Bacteroidota bacterium]